MMFLRHKTPLSEEEAGSKRTVKSALRRAFTITELVIVIAVVAILAAVLIPTFANIIDKANESADTQTVKNLNTILEANETLGDRADTVEEALAQALEGGYKVENLTPTSDGYDIVWDAANNRFALIDKDGNKIFGDPATPDNVAGTGCWQFSENYSDVSDNNYLWYMSPEAQLPVDGSGNLNVSTSINLSAFPELESVTVPANASGEIDITLNSDQTNLLIEGTATEPNDATINLYGTMGSVGILSSNGTLMGGNYGMNSLHIYGTVGRVAVASGKVVAESGSKISNVLITGLVRDYNISLEPLIKIEILPGGSIDYVGTSNDFNISKKANGSCDLEDAVVGDLSSTTLLTERKLVLAFSGVGTKEDPYSISSAEKFTTIKAGYTSIFNDSYYLKDNNPIYFKLDADIELTSRFVTTFPKMYLDLNGHKISFNVSDAAVDSGFHVQGNCELTISGNGKIETLSTSDTDYIFAVLGNGKLTIEDGTFIGGASVVQVQDNAVVEIYGGTYSILKPESNISYVLNYHDDFRKTAKITVYGGTFTNFNPSSPNEGTEVPTLLPNGYSVTTTSDATNTYYTVVAA